MIRHKVFSFGLILIFCFFGLTLEAKTSTRNPVEWINSLEMEITGKVEHGGILERIGKSENYLVGRSRDGSPVERLSYLDTIIYINQPYDICLIYKVQALEWVLFKEAKPGSLADRVENIEKLLNGTAYTGPYNKRLDKLITQVFSDGNVKGHWTDIPDGMLIKIRMDDTLSSVDNNPGDQFHFTVMETVTNRNRVLFMKGITGTGILEQVKRPENLGRDAQLKFDFGQIQALDGTLVKIFYGAKAMEINRSRQWAVGASAAGMLALGPGGILFGLVIKGKEQVIPAGTEFYIQVQEPVRIYTLEQ
jgi:hypothetical protein